uniref:Uncharacterized protein n=1 Tax=viral metagenome TaxID=1070528 RepID=A0A6C0F052_9ZZZZ
MFSNTRGIHKLGTLIGNVDKLMTEPTLAQEFIALEEDADEVEVLLLYSVDEVEGIDIFY